MVDLHDYDIELIEREILWKYNDNRHDYSDCDCLLSLRKSMINKRVLAHQEDILPGIIAFNVALFLGQMSDPGDLIGLPDKSGEKTETLMIYHSN